MPFGPSGPKDIYFMSCLAEEREHSTLLDLLSEGGHSPLPPWQAEPPPTFPFLESQCQRAPPRANFHSALDGTPPARKAGEAAWARVICGRGPRSQIPKSKYFQGLWMVTHARFPPVFRLVPIALRPQSLACKAPTCTRRKRALSQKTGGGPHK